MEQRTRVYVKKQVSALLRRKLSCRKGKEGLGQVIEIQFFIAGKTKHILLYYSIPGQYARLF